MHSSAEDIVLLLNHRTIVTTNTDRDRDPVILFAVCRNSRLHQDRRIHGVVDTAKRRHHLVTDRLDDGPFELMGRILHDIETYSDSLAGFCIAKLVIQLRAADDISKQNCNFQVFRHPALPITLQKPNARPGL